MGGQRNRGRNVGRGLSRNGQGPQHRSQRAIMPLLGMPTARVSPAERCKPACKPRVDRSEKKRKGYEIKSDRPAKTEGETQSADDERERERE